MFSMEPIFVVTKTTMYREDLICEQGISNSENQLASFDRATSISYPENHPVSMENQSE
jgi:hypothetical protein